MCGGQNASRHFNNILPHSFRSSWKNLPPNFFGKKDESKQMKKGEAGANLSGDKLTHVPKYTQFSREHRLYYHLFFITTSLGLMKIQCRKVINEENQTFSIKLHN